MLGTISFQRERLDESIVFFRKAIQLDERLVGAHLSLAQVYMLQGEPARALTLFEHVLKVAPSNADARLGVAWSAMEAGQYRRSMELAAPLMAEWTPASNVPPDLAIKFGVLFATHGAAPQAIAILERIRTATRPSYELAFNLAGAYLLNNDPARALEYMTRRSRSSRIRVPRCARPRRFPSSAGSSSDRSRIGCAPRRSIQTIQRSFWASVACASGWICWTTRRQRLSRRQP